MSDVTLVITTKDRPAMLAECLASVPPGVETIVIDDGKLGLGFVRARLVGLAQVETPYFAFLDDDDTLGPDWLPLSMAKMEQGFDVVAASYWETDSALTPTRQRLLLPATLSRLLSGHCPVNDGALVRRSVLEGVTWHPERDTVAMYSLWLELAAKGAYFGVVETPCWYHRLHRGNMSAALPEQDAAWRAEAIAEWRAVPA